MPAPWQAKNTVAQVTETKHIPDKGKFEKQKGGQSQNYSTGEPAAKPKT